MKFSEFFEKSVNTKKNYKIIFLTGEDSVLKEVIIKDYMKFFKAPVEREKVIVNNIKNIAALMSEGSFGGVRLFEFSITSKMKNADLWSSIIENVRSFRNCMVVRFPGDLTGLPEAAIRTSSLVTIVECNFPKKVKERMKLIGSRLRYTGCSVSEILIKEMASRVNNSADMENIVYITSLLEQAQTPVTHHDIISILGDNQSSYVNTEALLRGDINVLSEDIESQEPILLLNVWFSALKKYYCWLCKEGKNEELTETPEQEDVDEESSSETVSKISPYLVKIYKRAKESYSLQLVREVMENLNLIYQDVRKGHDRDWKERARMSIQKLNQNLKVLG